MQQLKLIENLLPEDLENLQGLIRDLRDFGLYETTDEWAVLIGVYYVQVYGRPSEPCSCDGIGTSLFFYFGHRKTLENYFREDSISSLSAEESAQAIAYWQQRLKWWQNRLCFSRQEEPELEVLELKAISKCNEILKILRNAAQ